VLQLGTKFPVIPDLLYMGCSSAWSRIRAAVISETPTMKSLLYLLALLSVVLGNFSSRYAFNRTLYDRGGDTYVLHWNFSIAERTIAIAVNVSTTGWVGFGVSPNGGMLNSDVVIGWVRNGRAYFHVSLCETIQLESVE